jgi:hypothetical protein
MFVCGGLLLLVSAVLADPLDPIPPEQVAMIAPRLIEEAGKLADPPIKIDADADKATGLFRQGVGGLMVVPVKGLKADGLNNATEENGAAAGYFFLYRLRPVINGKTLEADKHSTVILKDDNGAEREIAVLRLAAKKISDTEWTLLIFAKDNKPVLTAAFRQEANGSDRPVSLSAKEGQNVQGTLTITLFGKYAADVPLARLQ